MGDREETSVFGDDLFNADDSFANDVALEEENRERCHQQSLVELREGAVPAFIKNVLPHNPLLRLEVLDGLVLPVYEKLKKRGEFIDQTSLKSELKRKWEHEEGFRSTVRARIQEALKRGHLERRHSHKAVANLEPQELPIGSTWSARGDLDIGLDSMLEAPPDEVALALASQIVGTRPRGIRTTTTALVIGAGCRSVALCVDGIESGLRRSKSRIQIIEVDAFEWPREARCGEAARLKWDQALAISRPVTDPKELARGIYSKLVRPTFDIIVVTPPCPAQGVAAQLRNRYLTDGSTHSRTATDPGRFGPKRWLRAVSASLESGLNRLRPGGTVIGLIPLGIRATFHDAGEERKAGSTYINAPELFETFRDVGEELGLTVQRTIDVVEVESRNQPEVARRRSTFKLFVARKADPNV